MIEFPKKIICPVCKKEELKNLSGVFQLGYFHCKECGIRIYLEEEWAVPDSDDD